MILWLGIVIGVMTGMGVSKWRGHLYHTPTLNHSWLVFVGFLPQFLVMYLEKARITIPEWLVALSILISYFLLLVFTWLNRHLPGMQVLITGLILNLIVIASNGGFMPISPMTAGRLVGEEVVSNLILGSRFGFKDILLAPYETRLGLLSDRFLFPASFPYQVAFSLGDIFIAFGVFWILAYQKSEN